MRSLKKRMKLTRMSLLGIVVAVFFIVVSLVFACYTRTPHYQASQYVHSLPVVADPVGFATTFDTRGKQIADVDLSWQCKPWVVKCAGNDYIPSPIFPNTEIEFDIVKIQSCNNPETAVLQENDDRTIYVDRYWHVFWVGIQRCGEKEYYFGPYQMPS